MKRNFINEMDAEIKAISCDKNRYFNKAIHFRILVDLGVKKIMQPSSAFSPLYRGFYRLLIAISIDYWLPMDTNMVCLLN